MYNLNWKGTRIKRQIKFPHIIGFRIITEGGPSKVFGKKGFLKSFWRPVFKNTYFEEHLQMTASVISKITVIPKDNGFTITEPHRRYFSWKSPRFCEVTLDGVFKVITTDKNMFNVGIKVTFASIYVIFR